MRIRYVTLSGWVLLFAIVCVLLYTSFLQFRSPAFYDPDSYYHIAVSRFIKDLGPHYPFHWAQFSTFKDSFADKDFFFHLTIVPFFSLTRDVVLAGKYAFVFLAAIFFAAYAFILRKYLPGLLAAAFLFLPLLSPVFTSYFLQLRSVTLANVLAILGIYFIIKERPRHLFFIAAVYSLTHISFFTLAVIALSGEALRRAFTKEFHARNIYAVLLGTAFGCLINPNFPHNLYAVYLNGIVLPLHAMAGVDFVSASEHMPFDTRLTFITNSGVFAALNVIAWVALLGRRKMSFASAVWGAATNAYLILAFFGNRYWYQVNVLAFIFLASYARDCVAERGWRANARGVCAAAGIFLIAVIPFIRTNSGQLARFMGFSAARSSHLEDVGRWMERNIPAGETVYHSACADASYFMCLNPKDDYINVADAIYMYHQYPGEFRLIDELMLGRIIPPHAAIRGVFKARYGYVNGYEAPLVRQLYEYPQDIKILYANPEGVVFEIIGKGS